MPLLKRLILAGAGVAIATAASASVVAINQPAESVTAARIAALPVAQRGPWSAYLARSAAQMRADQAALAAERAGLATIPATPASGNGEATMPLDREPAWYASPEGRHVADVILSFQTPAGGWGKNQPRNGDVRQKGQAYVADNGLAHPSPNDFDASDAWHYVGTLDNDATITEIRFLARVGAAVPTREAARYREAALRGIRYLLNAQFPNGGWPQVWPLEGRYHDAITYNDDAMTHALDLMSQIASGEKSFAFVPAEIRTRARASVARGLDCIIRTQVVVNGRRTGWGQQHDALTLRMTSARNYEPAELASSESAALLVYLMQLLNPSPAVAAAVEAGVDWLRTTMIRDRVWSDANDGQGKRLQVQAGAPPVWARYYVATSNTPIFGDRDKTLHDDVLELSAGRRRGYAWFVTTPAAALTAYDRWKPQH